MISPLCISLIILSTDERGVSGHKLLFIFLCKSETRDKTQYIVILCMCSLWETFIVRGDLNQLYVWPLPGPRRRISHYTSALHPASLWRARYISVTRSMRACEHRSSLTVRKCTQRFSVSWPGGSNWQRLDDNILTKIISVLTLNVFNSWWYSLLVHNACKEVLEEFCHFILLLLEDKMHQNNISFEDLLEIY